ncbi:MAG: family 1 extracellular solute-binding protein [Paenibacillus sp.]|nr:family 1 extracellular solute-binding protein [Paenibacillus sp.]
MLTRRAWLSGMLVLSLATAVGCSNDTESAKSPAAEGGASKTPEAAVDTTKYTGGPVELTVCDYSTGVNEEEFQKIFAGPVSAKYPDIKMKLTGKCNTAQINNDIAANKLADIILFDNTAVGEMLDAKLPIDLSQTIKSKKVDLTPIATDITRTVLRSDGTVIGIPFARNFSAMIYNKDLFDRFAVPYPKETPTWPELIELNRRMTRVDNGVQYIGIGVNSMRALIRQYDMYPIDLKTNTAKITTDGYKTILSVLQQIYTTPGYVQNGKYAYNATHFFKDEILAMQQYQLAGIAVTANQYKDKTFKWDLTSDPLFEQRPNIAGAVNYYMASITTTSTKKDAAFYAIATPLSPEVQTVVSRGGRLTVLSDTAIINQLAADSGLFKDKNLKAVLKVQAAPSPVTTKYDNDMYTIINTEMIDNVVLKGTDINTALREAEEKINRQVLTK